MEEDENKIIFLEELEKISQQFDIGAILYSNQVEQERLVILVFKELNQDLLNAIKNIFILINFKLDHSTQYSHYQLSFNLLKVDIYHLNTKDIIESFSLQYGEFKKLR